MRGKGNEGGHETAKIQAPIAVFRQAIIFSVQDLSSAASSPSMRRRTLGSVPE